MSAPARLPLVDLRRQYESLRGEIDAAVAHVMETSAFINGPDVEAFEREFAAYCGVRHCVGVSSGLEALRLALAAMGIGSDDEVIVPANTFVATAFAVSATGARPVLVDCDPATHNIAPEAVARAITARTKAIVPVHLYGRAADCEALEAIAAPRGIALIEDAAQAHGARRGRRRCGALGRAAAFSFYPGKNLGAFGDAGAVTTDDDSIAAYVRAARDYGQRRKYEHIVKGGNWRLDTVQAAVLRVKLRHLDEWNTARHRAAATYAERLKGVAGLRLPSAANEDDGHVWHLYVVQCEKRDRLLRDLNERGIGAGVHYPIPIHLQPAYADLGHARGAFPHAERQAERVLSLPLFPEITDAEIARVCEAVTSCLGS